MSNVKFSFNKDQLRKVALKAAMKYGKKREGLPTQDGVPTTTYTYKDKVFIVNDATDEEVASYKLPRGLEEVAVSAEDQAEHERTARDSKANPGAWRSNTVVVVDTSGSMKKGDVDGAESRLKAVWATFANDYVYRRIQEGAGGLNDMVSIVSFSNNVEDILLQEPTTWILYNKLCCIHDSGVPAPGGHGHFIPGLRRAEEILKANSCNLACAMNLIFLSDGRPSDFQQLRTSPSGCYDSIEQHVEKLASRFGRRLNFSTIGIGKVGSEFEMLRRMVNAAADYGAQAKFRLPQMSCGSLGTSLTESATMLARTQLEMLDSRSMKQRRMKPIERESRKQAQQFPTTVSESDFAIYPIEDVFREKFLETEVQMERRRRWQGVFVQVGLQHAKATYVALKKKALGQGAERFAFQFYEVAKDRQTIVGRRYIAKESCFILSNEEGENSRRRFVRKFCMTQQFTSRIAMEFNAELDSLGVIGEGIPRVKVLECSVYHLGDPEQGEISVLVEPRLNHMKWTKWNSNIGYVVRERRVTGTNHLNLESELSRKIETIEEDEESMSSDGSQRSQDNELTLLGTGKRESISDSIDFPSTLQFTPSQVAQAFSHFSYVATGERRLICDVQGVHDELSNQLIISDPVIHQFYHGRKEQRENLYGRSDLGGRGMRLFASKHLCSGLCKLVTIRLRPPKYLFCSRKRSHEDENNKAERKRFRHS